ncbi:glycosyltransferase family protein [Scopulibacillus cellulosilyticus]|uniref:Glycosyltransferase n=1 Tax=Scopulibacillus cellulosilyticus TaxID=2665665 RepID=A0ABW2Q061_9BACL
MTGLEKVNIPIGYMPHDVDDYVEIRRQYLQKSKVSLIFPLYKNNFLNLYPEFATKVRWLPHHVNTEFFRDYNLYEGIDGLLIGRVSASFYQLRKKILEKMNGHPGFKYYIHPSDQPGNPALTVPEYPRLINQSKTFFTCCSSRKYALLKYFEVLACKTLLLADTCSDLIELGFKPNVHFVEINETNFYEKFLYYINNDSERNYIAANGYNFVRNHHTTKIRAHQLLSYIQSYFQS